MDPATLIGLAAMIGGPPLISAFLEWMHPVSEGQKELLALQQKGEREQFDRENLATKALQQEDANAKWAQVMAQLGLGQAQQKYEQKVNAIQTKASTDIQANNAQLPYTMSLEGSKLASLMEKPVSTKELLGL